MEVPPPKTIQDFEKILETILELQSNRFCDRMMFLDLLRRENNVRCEIALLKEKRLVYEILIYGYGKKINNIRTAEV